MIPSGDCLITQTEGFLLFIALVYCSFLLIYLPYFSLQSSFSNKILGFFPFLELSNLSVPFSFLLVIFSNIIFVNIIVVDDWLFSYPIFSFLHFSLPFLAILSAISIIIAQDDWLCFLPSFGIVPYLPPFLDILFAVSHLAGLVRCFENLFSNYSGQSQRL